jgi:hypothetical protein
MVVHWQSAQAQVLTTRLTEAERCYASEDFVGVHTRVTAIGQELEDIVKTAAEFDLLHTSLEQFRQGMQALHAKAVTEFDTAGRRDIELFFDRVALSLNGGHADKARSNIEQIERRFVTHQRVVQEELQRWQTQRDAATEKVHGARDRLDALLSDSVVSRWMGSKLEALNQRIQKAEAAIANSQFADAVRFTDGVVEQAERLAHEAEPLELQAAIQHQIADGIQEAMEELGFGLEREEEDQDNPNSAILFRALKDVGGLQPAAIAVAVEQSGHIEYDVAGAFEKRESYDPELRRPVHTCDEAEQQLLKIHALLRRIGIETTDIKWDGKPPNDPNAAAQDATDFYRETTLHQHTREFRP